MSGSSSVYLTNKLLDHSLGTTSFTKPTTIYMSLRTSVSSNLTAGTEVSGGSYARKIVTFSASSSGACTNSGTVTFSGMPGCTVYSLCLHDSLTSGNLLYFSNLDSARVVVANDSIVFVAGYFNVSLL